MSNNKQQTAVEWFLDQLIEHRIIIVDKTTYQVKYKHEILLEQAKKMYQEEIEEKLNVAYGNGYEQGEMDFYKKMRGKEISYADGYAEGYKRAMELVEFAIEQIKGNK